MYKYKYKIFIKLISSQKLLKFLSNFGGYKALSCSVQLQNNKIEFDIFFVMKLNIQ